MIKLVQWTSLVIQQLETEFLNIYMQEMKVDLHQTGIFHKIKMGKR